MQIKAGFQLNIYCEGQTETANKITNSKSTVYWFLFCSNDNKAKHFQVVDSLIRDLFVLRIVCVTIAN